MHFHETTIRSIVLGNERRLWLQPPALHHPPKAVLFLLDGEYYVQRMEAPEIIADLQTSNVIPSLATAYVSHIDGQTRWIESFCNADFARFLCDELVPQVRKHFADDNGKARIILGGLSLTGLAAAHAALVNPSKFAGVLCQSASFWWSNQQLIKETPESNRTSTKFRISCGSQETQDYVEHGPDLIQRTSQLASNRAMRDALVAKGHFVSYEEFDGGHNIASWKNDLPKSLMAILASTN